MRYCGHFLIKAEGGAKNYERDYPLPLAWRPFTVVFVQRKGYIRTYLKSHLNTNMTELARFARSLMNIQHLLVEHRYYCTPGSEYLPRPSVIVIP